MAKMRLTLKQGFMLIDDTCARQPQALHGLESLARSLVSTNQKFRETAEQFHGQLSVLQQQTTKMAKDLNLEWRMQGIEDELAKLHQNARNGDWQQFNAIGKEMQTLRQNLLWHDMEVAVVEA